MNALAASLAILLSGAGVWLLHAAWARRTGGWIAPAGWLLMGAAAWPWHASGAAWDKAIALTALAPSLAAIAILAGKAELGVSRRSERANGAEAARAPSARPRWRGWARALLAGPGAAAAALALASATALRAPGVEADRFVAALFVMPTAWAIGAVWATTDARLLRVSLALGVAALAGFGIAGA